MSRLFLLLSVLVLARSCAEATDCTFPSPTASKSALLKSLEALKGHTRWVAAGMHNYTVGVCVEANSSMLGVGAVQQIAGNESVPLGLLNQTDVTGNGTGWVLLTYGGGQVYKGTACHNEIRKTMVMFVCNRSAHEMRLTFVEESKVIQDDCYYMFQIETDVLCRKTNPVTEEGLSTSSIFCILLLVGVSVYLLIGLAYRRLIVGAKGLEQVPNYEFWKEFGRLEADGCDFICRCGDRYSSRAYRDIDSHLTNEFSDTNADRDDALLRP